MYSWAEMRLFDKYSDGHITTTEVFVVGASD